MNDHRIISPIEMYSVARHNRNYYKSVVFYIRFEILEYSISEWLTSIEKCLRLTINAQPRLRLQVDLSRKEPFFIILPMNIFDCLPIQIIQRTNHNDYDDKQDIFLNQIIENETNIGFHYNTYLPLWRIIILISHYSNTFDIIMTFNHAIADGISGMAFFTTFIEYLSNKSSMIYTLNNDRPLHEIIPYKLPKYSSLILQIIEKILLPNILSKYFFSKTYWTGNIQKNENNLLFKTHLVSFKLSNEILDLLHKKCQLEKTTIHTAILSSLLLSIIEIIDKKNLEFSCSTAINLRQYCQPIISNKQMGVFISAANTYHYIPYREYLLDLFWPLSRQIKEQINQEIQHSVIPLIHSLKFIHNWNQFLIDQRKTLPNGYQHSVEISNLLRWSFKTNNTSLKILYGGFTQSANIIGNVFLLSVVTINDILNVYISFHEENFQNIQQVNFIKDRMKQILNQVIYL
ncbi:unnamed protein product [Rotaria sp. Silwood1]|nr:unnamed protein product [Rotaria sp. Silwood1]CAF3756724.1 unnamed protein product [Rotaria sp. Silwood1]CAF3777319.1 unnamed protein product [Rotaria sp. Silwood1]CAF4957159.1 unnamed protein product [Rotaria sp. Silwood1]CAF5089133.1 unnamed protein product [Rotaria sp. Silwood1]